MSTRSGSSSVTGHHNPYLVKRSYSTPCENNSGGDSSDVVMIEEGSGGGPSGSFGRSLKSRMSKTPPMTPMRDNNNKSNKSGNNNPGKMIAFKILLLDDSVTIIQAQTKALGRLVFDQICKQLNVLESDYFGLEYNDEQGVTYWLDLEKRLTRQVGLSPVEPSLKFSVKFYTPDPSQLEEEFTRYLFSLQIKRDLANGTLQCNDNTAALMASFIVQAECGDFSEEDYPDPTYLSVFKFVPHQKYDLERKIRENHKKHIGQSPAEADLHLLETARRTELYGVRVHPGKDEDGVNLNLSVCHMGVLVFQNMTKINTFSWAKIRKISFKRKRFILKLHPETYFQELETFQGYYKELVEFIFDSRNECKAYWKRCVEHHAFFRCEKAPNPIHRSKGILSSRGSSFRYSGRTQKQMVAFVRENFIKRPPANQYHSMSQQNLSTMGVSSFDTQSQHQSHGLPYNTSQPHQFQRSSSFKTHQQQLQQQQQAQQQRAFYGERPGILGSQQAVTNSRSSPAMISDERVEERQTNYDDEEELEEEEEEDEEEEFSDYVVDNEKGSGGRRQKSTGTHPPPIGNKPLPPGRVTTPDTSVTSSPIRAEESPYKPVGAQPPPQHQPAQVSVYYGHGGAQGHGDYMQQVRHQSYHHHQPGGGLVLRNGTIGPSGTHYRSNPAHYANQPLEHTHSHTLGRTSHSHTQHQQQQQHQQYYYAHLPPHPQQPQNNLDRQGHTRSSSMNYYDSKVTPPALPPDWYYYMTKELLNIYRTYAQDIRLLKSYEKNFPFFQATLNLSRSFKQNIEDIKKEVWESRNGNEILYQLIKYFEQYKPSYLDYFNFVSTSYTKICLNDLSNHYISKCCLYLRPFEFIKYLYIDLVQGILLPQFSNANYLNSPTGANANNVNNNITTGMHNVSFSSFKSNSNSSQNLNNSYTHLLDYKLVDKLVKTLEILYYKSDELKRGIQTKSKVLELHKELHGFPLLDDKAGDFIRQGILLKLNKKRGLQNRIFFLFRDVMAYGSRINSSQGFRLHGIIPTSQMELSEINQVEINGIPHSFIVNVNQELESFGSNSTIHQKILVLAAFNEKDKVAWTEGIGQAIKYSMKIEGVNQLLINNYNSSEEILKSTSESLELQPIIVQQQQHRSNATTHVCWHRNLSVSSEMLLKAYGCTISGYLLRKFKNSPGWQRLWVVYTNVCLYFYKSHHEEDHSEEELPLASLPLLGYRVEVPNDSDNIHKDHVFKLSFKNHVYFFRAESPFTFQRWVSTLKASTSLTSYAAPTSPPPFTATKSNINYS